MAASRSFASFSYRTNYLGISRKTLQKWRSLGLGPDYLKLGAKVVYRIEDVNAYIRRSLRIQKP